MGGAGVWLDVGEFGFLLEEETNPGSTRAMPLTEASHRVSAASSLKLCTWARLWICPRPLTHTTYPPPRPLPGPSPTLTPVLPLSGSQVQSGECGAGVDGGRISRSTEGRRPAVVAALLKNPADKPTEARARLHHRDAKPRARCVSTPRARRHRLEPPLVLVFLVVFFCSSSTVTGRRPRRCFQATRLSRTKAIFPGGSLKAPCGVYCSTNTLCLL